MIGAAGMLNTGGINTLTAGGCVIIAAGGMLNDGMTNAGGFGGVGAAVTRNFNSLNLMI
jgi:hypothetical protein